MAQDPKTINQLNRYFYKQDVGPSFWERHGFLILLWLIGALGIVFPFLPDFLILFWLTGVLGSVATLLYLFAGSRR